MSLKKKGERDAVCYPHCANRKRWKYFGRRGYVLLSAGYKERDYYCSYTERNVRDCLLSIDQHGLYM